MSKFNIGDEVRVITNKYPDINVWDKGVVTATEDFGTMVRFDLGDDWRIVILSDGELMRDWSYLGTDGHIHLEAREATTCISTSPSAVTLTVRPEERVKKFTILYDNGSKYHVNNPRNCNVLSALPDMDDTLNYTTYGEITTSFKINMKDIAGIEIKMANGDVRFRKFKPCAVYKSELGKRYE